MDISELQLFSQRQPGSRLEQFGKMWIALCARNRWCLTKAYLEHSSRVWPWWSGVIQMQEPSQICLISVLLRGASCDSSFWLPECRGVQDLGCTTGQVLSSPIILFSIYAIPIFAKDQDYGRFLCLKWACQVSWVILHPMSQLFPVGITLSHAKKKRPKEFTGGHEGNCLVMEFCGQVVRGLLV